MSILVALAALAVNVLLLNSQRRTRRVILEEIRKNMTALDQLRAQVTASNTVTESAITLLQGLKEKLDEAILSDDSEAALQELSDALGAETLKLSQAVSANTPTVTAAGVDHSEPTAQTGSPAFEDLPDDHPLKGGSPAPAVPDVTGPVTDPAVINAPGSPIAQR